jgi:hypothetical protein
MNKIQRNKPPAFGVVMPSGHTSPRTTYNDRQMYFVQKQTVVKPKSNRINYFAAIIGGMMMGVLFALSIAIPVFLSVRCSSTEKQSTTSPPILTSKFYLFKILVPIKE